MNRIGVWVTQHLDHIKFDYLGYNSFKKLEKLHSFNIFWKYKYVAQSTRLPSYRKR